MSHRQNKTLMIQGTSSDAGKSVLVAGLGRVLARQKIKVAPLKPQNMALNSAVSDDGGEIGRAQAVQAQACRVAPHTDFNPVLLKPNTDVGAQIIIQGKAIGDMNAVDYHQFKSTAMKAVLDSHQRLEQNYQAVIVEGAGSPAEVNLRDRDIANMGFAEAVDCPVIIIADIDRGGVFAQFVGTLQLLSASEQARVIGFVINRFRGDMSLLQPGIDWLQQYTSKPVLGTLPYLHNFHLEAEDAIDTSQTLTTTEPLNIVVLVFPRISNHTDFDALRLHPQVNLHFIPPGDAIPRCDLIILPGSKNVRGDLDVLSNSEWGQSIKRHLRYGGKLLGICGGFQMLGNSIADPLAIEGPAGISTALGLLDFSTAIQPQKTLAKVTGKMTFCEENVYGYEIHAGASKGPALNKPFALLDGKPDGAISSDEQIIGSYVHGLFDHSDARNALLSWAGLNKACEFDYKEFQEHEIDRLADAIETHLDMVTILSHLNVN